jgi:putative transposase
VIGLFKTEVVRHAGPWKGLDDVELSSLEWVVVVQQPPAHGSAGLPSPAEYEMQYALAQVTPVVA